MESDEDNSIFPRVSSKTPSRLRDSFNALNSSRLAYKELENCRASATKREIEGMRFPVFGKGVNRFMHSGLFMSCC